MVTDHLLGRDIRSEAVLSAMRAVPRHLFIPEEGRAHAYEDRPVSIGHRQTISQPYIVAYMTQALSPEPDQRVLEIGTGSGYQAAVLAELVKDRVDARQGEEPEGPLAFVVEHVDGLRTVTLMLNGAVGDFCYAASVEGGVGDDEGIVATTALRSPGPNVHYSACLASNAETMFATGKPTYDVRRTLLVGGVLEKGLLSLYEGCTKLERRPRRRNWRRSSMRRWARVPSTRVLDLLLR